MKNPFIVGQKFGYGQGTHVPSFVARRQFSIPDIQDVVIEICVAKADRDGRTVLIGRSNIDDLGCQYYFRRVGVVKPLKLMEVTEEAPRTNEYFLYQPIAEDSTAEQDAEQATRLADGWKSIVLDFQPNTATPSLE